jgi:hypothetical protein
MTWTKRGGFLIGRRASRFGGKICKRFHDSPSHFKCPIRITVLKQKLKSNNEKKNSSEVKLIFFVVVIEAGPLDSPG